MVEADEIRSLRQRYERRRVAIDPARYSKFDSYSLAADQEKDRAIVRLLKSAGMAPGVADRTLLEIGCGSGGNLLRFLQLGFRPENLIGNDVLEDRLDEATHVLPKGLRLVPGDATALCFSDESFDIVCLFTVFSSILSDPFQESLAEKAWALVKPGGGILWYDFLYNNPANPDVRAVPVKKLRQLFPRSTCTMRRVTVVPPLGRIATRRWPGSYPLLSLVPGLRSHVLAWMQKGASLRAT